jgi:hypothetical protein
MTNIEGITWAPMLPGGVDRANKDWFCLWRPLACLSLFGGRETNSGQFRQNTVKDSDREKDARNYKIRHSCGELFVSLRCNIANGVRQLSKQHQPGSVTSCFAVVAEGRTTEILVPELLDSIAS